MKDHILDQLYATLLARKSADPEKSYVASLYKNGTKKITEKVIEETYETVEEALRDDNEKLKAESADLLFHLMILWAQQGITPQDVFEILEKRVGVSGLEEKFSRKID